MHIIKKISFISILALMLNACADSASINQEAASSYRQTINKARDKGVLDTTSNTSKRIHSVFHKMVPYADKENHTGQQFDWQISVIRSNELNAWAMPGGKMAFYTGLVETLKLNDDEIATVMGHEMAHALKEHGKSARNVGIATGVFGAVLDIGLSVALGGDATGLGSGTVDLIASKPYSRSKETEADEVGLMLMAKAGFNPQSAPKVWEKMQNAGGGSQGVLAALLSTHPNDKDRQANLLRLMPKAMAIYQQPVH